jgi:hypothetical protein
MGKDWEYSGRRAEERLIDSLTLRELFLHSTNIFSHIQGFNFSRIMDLDI